MSGENADSGGSAVQSGAHSPANKPPKKPQTDQQVKSGADAAWVVLALLSMFILVFGTSALLSRWNGEEWNYFAWIVQKSEGWKTTLVVIGTVLSVAFAALTHLYRSDRKIRWISGILILQLVLVFIVYSITTQPENAYKIGAHFDNSECSIASDSIQAVEPGKRRAVSEQCFAKEIDGFWVGLLAWMGLTLLTFWGAKAITSEAARKMVDKVTGGRSQEASSGDGGEATSGDSDNGG